ncbi:MAG TPA: hypothetical protein VK919_05040, partial [Solirubrobacterales bacterium]|nr:hypothetical protein [Solirubrobacterales bacterium]
MTDTGVYPVLLAVDEDPAALARIDAELTRRYGTDYRVIAKTSPFGALAELETLRESGEPVALVLAADSVCA